MANAPLCENCQAMRNDLFAAPEIPGALPPLPGNTVHLLPVTLQGQPLLVEMRSPWPAFENDPNTWIRFGLYVEGVVVETVDLFPPYDRDIQFPLLFTVPARSVATPTTYTIFCRALFSDFNYVDSGTILLEVDHRAPNHDNPGDQLRFPDEVVRDGLTQAWLELHNDQLRVEVPRWADMALEDEVLFYWGTIVDAEPVARLVINAAHLQPGSVIEFHYPGDALREKGNGFLNGYYVLSDRAGNRNDPSPPVPVEVIDLPVTPGRFPAPVVPLASIDKLIDLEDARTGVTVVIEEIPDALPGDTLQIWWNGRALPLLTLAPGFQWPQTAAVAWGILSSDGFAAPVAGNVQYRWQRGTSLFRDSPVTSFTVDLTVAGPDPIGPDPVNPNLEQLLVKGITGDDILIGPDIGNDARVLLKLYQNARAGDLLELHWGDHPDVAATYRVRPTDQPGDEIAFTVLWSIIESVGNHPQLPTFYWVSNGVNRQRSTATLVRVAVRPVEGLGPVTIPDATLYNYINCDHEPWNGIRVKIPGNALLLDAGDRIEMTWQLCRKTTGEDPMTEHVVLPPHELSATEAVEGVILLMDRFTELVLPLQMEDGSANIAYRLTKADGTPGISANKVLRISLVKPGAVRPCDGTWNAPPNDA